MGLKSPLSKAASSFDHYPEISCMQTGLCRMRTESLARPSPRTGKQISGVRDEGPQSASGRSSFPAETANGLLHPPQTAENRGCSAETGRQPDGYGARVFRGDGELGVGAELHGGGREDSTDGYQPRHPRCSQKGLAFCCEPSGSVVVLG
jgi:hypothetical protein